MSIALREEARKNELCDSWYKKWKDELTFEELLDKFVNGQAFCAEHNFPSLDFIRRNFTLEQLHKANIYLDEEVEIEGTNGKYVFLGHCTGHIAFHGFTAASVYLRHTSDLLIHIRDNSRVFITLFDQCNCETGDDLTARLRVYERRKKYMKY